MFIDETKHIYIQCLCIFWLNVAIIVKHSNLLFKLQKHADNISSKKVIMTNKVVRQLSKCANCVAEKSRFLKQKSKKHLVGIRLIYQMQVIIKHVDILFKMQKIQKMLIQKY